MYAQQSPAMAMPVYNYNARELEQLEKMRRSRLEIREMLCKIDRDLKSIEDRMQPASVPPSYPVHVVYPMAYVPPRIAHVQYARPPSPMRIPPKVESFDVSKVDPIFREAAKDKAIRLRFMDCTDLAVQCARVRHRA